MAISFPVSLPSTSGLNSIVIRLSDVIGLQASPITFGQTLYDWGGDFMEADISVPPMKRADAEAWVTFLWKLRGQLGTFLMGDPANSSPRGTWAGSPKVLGAHAAGVRTIAMDGFTAAATGKEGDWIQFGTGSTSELKKVLQDFTADGSGLATVEIGPRMRRPLADNDTFATSSPKGLWQLASNTREYSIGLARMYGLRFSCVEALRI